MKHYTIKINKNNNSGINFRNNNNASKALDDLILSNMIKMNPYLAYKKKDNLLGSMFDAAGFDSSDNDTIIISNRPNSNFLKGTFDARFAEAAKFLASYTPTKKIYFTDGTPIAFFEDEIQIGDTLIPLYELTSPKYYNAFTPETKKIIINIFISIKG
jgi:hypothetical protein